MQFFRQAGTRETAIGMTVGMPTMWASSGPLGMRCFSNSPSQMVSRKAADLLRLERFQDSLFNMIRFTGIPKSQTLL